MRSFAIFVGLLASLTLTTLSATFDAPRAEAKGIRQLQYTVKEGDTIYDLARRFGCTEKDLQRSNQLGPVLAIGQKLRIPDCGKQPAPTSKPAVKAAAKLSPKPAPEGKRAEKGRLAEAVEPAAPKAKPTPAGERLSERSTASRAVETPQRAHGKVASHAAVRPRSPVARAKAPARLGAGREFGGEAPTAEVGEIGEIVGEVTTAPPAVDPETGSVAGARSARTAQASAARPAASPVPSPAPSKRGGLPRASGVADPVTGSIATSASAALTGAITRPSEVDRSRALGEELGAPSDPLDEASPYDSDELEAAADLKLVIDGRGPSGGKAGALLDPAGAPSGQSIGLPWRGRLQSAARLGYGEGYVLRRPQRTYGTRTTVAHVEAALAELRQKFPRLHTLAVGDLSAVGGGRISEHRSHQSGRDIDLGLCFHERPRGYPEHFVVATEKTLNAAATFALISALADTAGQDGGLSMIFLDFNVQGMIYRWALSEGIDQERLDRIFQYPHGRGSGLGIVRHAPNHADHLHARFHCAADETGCRR